MSDTRSGGTPEIEETEETISRGLSELSEAIARIPEDMKVDYLSAMRICPQLVETESEPIMFLRREDYDPWAAGQRVCNYWKMRRSIFGDRAFRTITLGPEGPFLAEDIEVLRCAHIAVGPCDDRGRSVIVVDGSRQRAAPPTRESQLRYSFFLMNELSKNPVNARHGARVVIIVNKLGSQYFGRVSRRAIDILTASPLRISRAFLVCSPRDFSKFDFLANAMPFVLKLIGSFLGKMAVPVFGDSLDDIREALEDHGFQRTCFPTSIGGSWTYDCWLSFLQSRGLPQAEQDIMPSFTTSKVEVAPSDGQSRCVSNEPEVSNCFESVASRVVDNAVTELPADERKDYEDAKKFAPGLVLRESPHERFLVSEGNVPAAAARLLTSYWATRKRIYSTMAFLPMSCTEEELDSIQSHFVSILPSDTEGQVVLCFDETRLVNIADQFEESRHRMLFYCMQRLSERVQDSASEFVLIYVLADRREGESNFARTLRHPLQVRLKAVHIVCLVTDPSSHVSSHSALAGAFRVADTFWGKPVTIHAATRGPAMLSRLEPFGLCADCLPSSLGGTWEDVGFWESAFFHSFVPQPQKSSISHQSTPTTPSINESNNEIGSARASSCGPGTDSGPGEPRISANDRFLKEIETAISLLPLDQTAELLEARRVIPELAAEEAPPTRFLRVENFDCWAAASRLALYWKERRAIFGDRAFLPMQMTGEGTLTRDEAAALSHNYTMVTGADTDGRTVMLLDHAKKADLTDEARFRIVFYMLSVASENPLTQTDGLVGICGSDLSLDQASKTISRLITEILPIRIHNLHVCHLPSEKPSLLNAMIRHLLQIAGIVIKNRVKVHVGASKGALAEKLIHEGLFRERIPKKFGGDLTEEDLEAWQECRIRYEWKLPFDQRGRPGLHGIPAYEVRARSELSEEEKVERKRRLNVLNSRRKRGRVRVELESLTTQVTELQRLKAGILQEGERLEKLLNGAHMELARHTRPQPMVPLGSPFGRLFGFGTGDAYAPQPVASDMFFATQQPIFPTSQSPVDVLAGSTRMAAFVSSEGASVNAQNPGRHALPFQPFTSPHPTTLLSSETDGTRKRRRL